MVLPLLLNPWTLGILGSVLPSVISALAGSKTPEEARAAIEPQHNAMVTQLIGRGMRRSEAIAQADEALKGALADKAQEGSVPPWADAVMSVAGGIGGGALGAKLAKGAVKGAMQGVGKAGVADAAKAATVEKAANTATKGIREVPDAAYAARKGEINAANKAAADAGKFDRVDADGPAMEGRELALRRPDGDELGTRSPAQTLVPDEVIPPASRDFIMPSSERGLVAPFDAGVDPVSHQQALRRGASRRPMMDPGAPPEIRGLPMSNETRVRRMAGSDEGRQAAFADAEEAARAAKDADRAAAYDEVRRVRGAGRPAYHEDALISPFGG